MRAALFNWLGNDCAGMRCLDLFAGSGALSLEALSRGARHCTLVELSAGGMRALRGQMAEFAPGESYRLVRARAERWLRDCEGAWDLVFLDPPYDFRQTEECLHLITQRELLRPGGLLYLESRNGVPGAPDETGPGLQQVRERHSASHRQRLLQLA